MRILAVLVTVVSLAIPSVAGAASTASFTPRHLFNGPEFPYEFDPSYVKVVGDDASSAVTADAAGDSVVVNDSFGITAGQRCEQVSPTSVSCPRPDEGSVELGGGNDSAVLAPSVLGTALFIDGGAGDDVLTGPDRIVGGGDADVLTGVADSGDDDHDSDLLGGPGDDQLNGSDGNDVLLGGPGADTLKGGPGDDELDGDDGSSEGPFENDVLDGGEGIDALTWQDRDVGTAVDLSVGEAGAPGERDSLTGIETVRTGSGNDTLTGSAADETFDPNEGRDRVVAGAGDDVAIAGEIGFVPRRSDIYLLGEGNDWISYEGTGGTGLKEPVVVNLADPGPDGPAGARDKVRGAENVRGTVHRDRLIGDSGPNILVGNWDGDFLDGRRGEDTLSGGDDRDTLRARDGEADRVNCGNGRDRFRADRRDDVRRCENRD